MSNTIIVQRTKVLRRDQAGGYSQAPPVTIELREDLSRELREDGSFEIRERSS